MTTLEDIINRNIAAILDALQARFEARPLDPELQALFELAATSVSLVFPANAEQATEEQRAGYVASLKARMDSLGPLFRSSRDPARALRSLVICWHCIDRLEQAQYLDREQGNAMKGEVLAHYAVYAPIEPPQ